MRQNVQQKQTNKCAGMFIYSDARLQKKKAFLFYRNTRLSEPSPKTLQYPANPLLPKM